MAKRGLKVKLGVFMVITMLLVGIYYMNRWVTEEVEVVEQKQFQPEVPTVTASANRKTMLAKKRREMRLQLSHSNGSSNSDISVSKRKKIIYEIPLDEPFLVQ